MKKNKNWNKKIKKRLDEKGLDLIAGGTMLAPEMVEKLNSKMECAGTYEVCSGRKSSVKYMLNDMLKKEL